MMNHYLDLWNLSDPQPLATTVTSYLYTVTVNGERAVLKLLTEYGHEEKHGAAALRHFDGRGAVRLLRGDDQAHLLEYAGDENLVGMVKRGEDEQATAILAEVINQLHSAPGDIPANGLIPLRPWFRALFDRAAHDPAFVKAAAIADDYLNNPLDVRVLHGDIHHENVRYHNGRGWLAFDPKGLVGERGFDAANIFRNPMNMPDLVENEARILRTAAVLGQKMAIEPSRILTWVYLLASLSACWFLNDNGDPSFDLRIARLAEPHITPPAA